MRFEINGMQVGLDSAGKDLTFISHAHSDHLLRRKPQSIVLSSKATNSFSVERTGIELDPFTDDLSIKGVNFKMLDAGHILGSKALLMEGNEKVLYTGDFSQRQRHFLNGFKPVKCDTLMIESTFGTPEYVFPSDKEVFKEFYDYINYELCKGSNLLIMGYALGKAQHICKLLEKVSTPIYLHGSVMKMNNIHKEHGVKIYDFNNYSKLNGGQFIAVSPVMNAGSAFVQKLKKKNTKVIVFSGWAVNKNYKYFIGADEAFCLSDHADFKELINTVKKCSPSKIITYHGFSKELSDFLKIEGYDAEPHNN